MSTPAETERRIANMVRYGTVAAVDYGSRTVRVAIGDTITTNNLRWLALRAGNTRQWSPPTIGEQAIVLSPGGDLAAGVVLVGLYSDVHPSPSGSPAEHVIEHPDGARFSYDHESGALRITGVKTVLVEAADRLTVDCPQSTFTGAVTVEGLFTYQAGMRGYGGSKGANTAVTGPFTHVDGELSSNGVVLDSHRHSNSGGNGTGGPPV